jgi:hypothetical protein
MYKDSYLTMNNKNSAIFLATVLVAGIIGMASPLMASAEEYKYEKEKRYDSHDYKEEKKYNSYDPKYQKGECNVNTVNIGELTGFEKNILKSMEGDMELGAAVSTDEITNSLEGSGPTFGIGDNNGIEMQRNGGGGGIELEAENLCINAFNQNDLEIGLTG